MEERAKAKVVGVKLCGKGSRKKSSLFSDPATKRGVGGVRGVPVRKKVFFFLNMALLTQKMSVKIFFFSKFVSGYFKTNKKVPMATKPRGVGVRP